MSATKLKVRMINFDDGNGPQVSHVWGWIGGMDNLKELVEEYLDNSNSLDLEPGEFFREVTLRMEKQEHDSGYGFSYYLNDCSAVKVKKYTKKDIEEMKKARMENE